MSKRKPENFKNTPDPKEVVEASMGGLKPRAGKYFDDEETFDIQESMMYGILHGMKRKDIVLSCQSLAESWGIVDVPETALINLYHKSRDALFKYRLDTIEEEKRMFVERMYRLGAKAEALGDFANAFKAYDKIAQIAGVYAESDDSKVILNFVPVQKTQADVILDK